jgi:iron(III) transport system substrate-binding protein
MMKCNRMLIILGLLPTVFFGCRKEGDTPATSNRVVVYTSVDRIFSEPVLQAAEKRLGIKVVGVYDTEETKSTGLLNRLIAEKDRPVADVFWSGDPLRAAVLKVKGVSAPYQSPVARDLPDQLADPDHHWTGFSARARVIIFNRNQVSEGSEPKSVLDLADVRFRDKACMANPLFGTTSMHAAALFVALGPEKAKVFFESFTINGGRILSSNGEVRRRVAAGDFAVGLTDTDDYNVARMEGKPVGVVYPDAEGMGTVVVPNCAVLIQGGPNPDAARRFIDYLLSPEVENALAEGEAAQIPLRPGASNPAHVTGIDQLRPMPLGYTALAGDVERLGNEFIKAWVDRSQR